MTHTVVESLYLGADPNKEIKSIGEIGLFTFNRIAGVYFGFSNLRVLVLWWHVLAYFASSVDEILM